jgi:hypothetical protein
VGDVANFCSSRRIRGAGVSIARGGRTPGGSALRPALLATVGFWRIDCVEHRANRILAPNVATEVIGEEIIPNSCVADEQSIDGDGTAAAQNFVVVISGLVRRSAEFKIALERRVGMAEDGDRSTFYLLGVFLPKVNERIYFSLEFGKNERGIELETRILYASRRRTVLNSLEVAGPTRICNGSAAGCFPTTPPSVAA